MAQPVFRVYRYRWAMLCVFMAVVAVNQLLWITFAPITGSAAGYYGVSDLSIGVLSMCFMLVYIFVSVPASWLIDTYGVRLAVGAGALLTAVFGVARGLVASSYALVLVAQIGIAIGQPLILNAVTTVAARWFPREERATASGLGLLASYLGIVVGLVLSPYALLHLGMGDMLLAYGAAAVVAAAAFAAFSRERPPTPPCSAEQEERSLVFTGLGQALRQRNFLLLMLVVFVGLGIFNGVTTWIEDIVRPRGFSISQAGMAGGLMVIGGIFGALVIPLLSDRYRRRVPFLLLALCGATPGLVGITLASNYWLLLASAFLLGFFLLSAGPIAFQYGAEVTYPAPEGTTNGALLMMGQVSGILFIFGMDALKSSSTGSMTPALLGSIVLMLLSLLVCTGLKEPAWLLERQAEPEASALPADRTPVP
jgi:MFS family permease